MTDQPTGSAVSCPWCSATSGADSEGRCLSCGAVMFPDQVPGSLPGVTDVDTLGIIKQRGVRPTNRIVAWVTGDSPETENWTPAGEALEEPSLDVRREMLKLEFDAAIAAQQAELDAMRAEEALRAAEEASRGEPASALEDDAADSGPSEAVESQKPEPDVPQAAASESPAVAADDSPAEAEDEDQEESEAEVRIADEESPTS